MQVYEEVTPQEREEKIQETERRPVRRMRCSVTVVQAVLCVVILLLALAMKFLLPDQYGALRACYDAEMERSVLITYDDVSDL